jgi:hypothetical protein
MKKLSFLMIAGLMILAGTFTSCEKVAEEIENATEITVNTTLDAPMVAVPEANKAGEASFKEEEIIDISSNADLKDHLSKIKEIEAKSITVTINSSTPANLSLLSAAFSVTDNVTNKSFSFTAPSFPFLLTSGSSFTIDPTTPGWAELNLILGSMNPFTVKAIGTINSEEFSVAFTTSLGIKAVVKN